MKVFISTDMEGISGVFMAEHVMPDSGADYQWARQMMVGDVNAAVRGALAAGATAVTVHDAHNLRPNLFLEKLDPVVTYIAGKGLPNPWVTGLDSTYDALFLVGYHVMAGSEKGVLSHSFYARQPHRVRVGGQDIGETWLAAAVAGELGVPTVLVTGDSELIRQVRAVLGEVVEGVAVKDPLGRFAAHCLHPQRAQALIEAGARRALGTLPGRRPFSAPRPPRLELDLTTVNMADALAPLPFSTRTGPRTVELEGETYWQLSERLMAALELAKDATDRAFL